MELPLDANMALSQLPFGSTRSEVRAFLGGEPQSFQRSQADRGESDYWPHLGVFAYYDDAGKLEAIEFGLPAEPTLLGKVLTSMPMQKAKQLLNSIDASMEDESDGATSKTFGIGIWTGAGRYGTVQAVIRFMPGYYD